MPSTNQHMRDFVSNMLSVHTHHVYENTIPHIEQHTTHHFRSLLELSLNDHTPDIDHDEFVHHLYWYAIYSTMRAMRITDPNITVPSGDMFQIDEEGNM